MLVLPNIKINACWIGIQLLLITTTGCKKLLEADLPNDMLESGTLFSNDSSAMTALNGLYINIMNQTKHFLNGGMTLFPGLSADELKRTSSIVNEDDFFSNSLSANNSLVGNNIWIAAYSYIYHSNVCIDGLQKSTNVSPGLKKKLLGEAKFIRALCYYYLVNLFGEVPLATTPDADKNALLSRESVENIMDKIESDLEDGLEYLPDTIINTRPNKMTCQALLARVHLYMKRWSRAETAATLVINSDKYKMVYLKDVFKFQSQEIILQFAPVLAYLNSAEGNMFVPAMSGIRPAYVVTSELQAALESGDLRRAYWLDTISLNGIDYIIPYKYKRNNISPAEEYNVVLRLAEQYLIRAEARVRLNKISEAVTDINVVRTRASLPAISPNIGQAECLAAVEQERRIELLAEWGQRWFDLKRWDKAGEVLGILKVGFWQEHDRLYPIPATEIERDHNLMQNDGY